jgi:hypothetical protein
VIGVAWDCIEQGHILTDSAVCRECGYELAKSVAGAWPDLALTPRGRQVAKTIERIDADNDPHVADVPDLVIEDYAGDELIVKVSDNAIQRTLDGNAVIAQLITTVEAPDDAVELTRAQAQRVHDWLARVLREDTR